MDIEPRLRLRIGRALGYWLVPQGMREAQRRWRMAMRARRITSRNRHLLSRNAELHGRHAGRRCFVIGNGPSLARQDLSPLADEITFAVNGFWKHPVIERWSPTYYALVDPAFFDGTEACRTFFAELAARCPGSLVFVPAESGRLMEEQNLLPAAQTRYVAFNGHLSEGLPTPPDLTRTVPVAINVVLLAMMIAMYAGCSPIYLVGLDHDWLAHRGHFGHFFTGATIENHSSAALGDLSLTKYGALMETQLKLWRSYEALHAMANRMGTRILNATDGGFLDVFPRASYEEVAVPTTPPPIARRRST